MSAEQQHPPHLLRGIMLIMLAVFLFSSMDTLAKFMLKRERYPLPPLIWARYTVHLLFMLVLLAPRMGLDLLRTKRPGLQILRGTHPRSEHRVFLSIADLSAAGRSCCHHLRRTCIGHGAIRPHAGRTRHA